MEETTAVKPRKQVFLTIGPNLKRKRQQRNTQLHKRRRMNVEDPVDVAVAFHATGNDHAQRTPSAIRKPTKRVSSEVEWLPLLRLLYGEEKETLGTSGLRGQLIMQRTDYDVFVQSDHSACFGELLCRGAEQVFAVHNLNLGQACVFFDLGSGLGKLCIDAFLRFPNLQRVIGVELAGPRFEQSVLAVERLRTHLLSSSTPEHDRPEDVVLASKHDNTTLTEYWGDSIDVSRDLELRRGDVFAKTQDLAVADAVFCDIKFQESHHGDICKMLDCMKPGARIASYEPLEQVYKTTNLVMPFARVRDGVLLAATTWRGEVNDGHRFWLYERVGEPIRVV